MDVISYEYTKERREFGVQPKFEDTPTRVFHSVVSSDQVETTGCPVCVARTNVEEEEAQWELRKSTTLELDCIPTMSDHEVNTDRIDFAHQGMEHTAGGWPYPEVKTQEPTETDRFVERIKMRKEYNVAVRELSSRAENVVRQNNTIDLYEEYFKDDALDIVVQPPSAKTVAVFRDRPGKDTAEPNPRRPVTSICWHPDGSPKLATSYSVLQFQQTPDNMPVSSYIWDVNNPNEPVGELVPKSPLCCLVYNPKTSDHLVGGSYNGLVAFWDTRRGSKWIACSDIENSHHDPVYDISWIQSRTGNECASISTDGQLLWWDVRNLSAGPTDSLMLKPVDTVFGGTKLEYRTDAGATRYLCGTEQGEVLLVDRKAKGAGKDAIKAYGHLSGSHHGPIYALQRHPTVSPKYFMTAGDWTAKIWNEDLRTPIFTTKYDSTYLTGGCWSPTRPGVFFTTKLDGSLDIWDIFYKHNDPAFSTKIGDFSISSISVHQRGKLVAVGAEDGTCTIMEISDSLAEPQKNEKKILADMLDRETRREKQLEIRAKEKKRERALAERKKNKPVAKDLEEKPVELLKEVEEKFFKALDMKMPDISLLEETELVEQQAQKGGGGAGGVQDPDSLIQTATKMAHDESKEKIRQEQDDTDK